MARPPTSFSDSRIWAGVPSGSVKPRMIVLPSGATSHAERLRFDCHREQFLRYIQANISYPAKGCPVPGLLDRISLSTDRIDKIESFRHRVHDARIGCLASRQRRDLWKLPALMARMRPRLLASGLKRGALFPFVHHPMRRDV